MKIRDILEAESPGGALSTAQVDAAQDKALPGGNFELGGKAGEILRSATNKPLLTQSSNRGVVGPVQKVIWDHVRRGRGWADGLMQSVQRTLPNEQQQEAAYDYFMAANKAWHMANQAQMGESFMGIGDARSGPDDLDPADWMEKRLRNLPKNSNIQLVSTGRQGPTPKRSPFEQRVATLKALVNDLNGTLRGLAKTNLRDVQGMVAILDKIWELIQVKRD